MEPSAVPEDSLLQLNIEEIRSIKFGLNFLEYQLGAETFRLTFSSSQAMELAIDKWLRTASERGQFFRLGVMKSLLRQHPRNPRKRLNRPSI